MKATLIAMGLAVSVAVSGGALAQGKSAAEGIAEYRKMLADGNPAERYEAKGEALWKSLLVTRGDIITASIDGVPSAAVASSIRVPHASGAPACFASDSSVSA